jgi:uncharacterized protein (TIGR03083 family)
MSDRERTIRALEDCWKSLDALLGDLALEEWTVASLCPGWTVRDVVAHLASVEHLLTDWFPESAETPLPFERVAAFLAETAELDGPAMLGRYRDLVDRRRAQLGELTDEQWVTPSMTPVGPATYGRFMAIRVFDFWVHEQDIRSPLGRPGHETGPAAEMSVDEVQGALGYVVGKKIGLPDGMGITFRLTGPVRRELHARVEGRARVVPELADPDVVVTADSLTFVQLACGRIDPQEPIDAGRITWTGAPEWGERAARHLRFTM